MVELWGRYAIGQRVACASLCAPVGDTKMVVVQLAGSFKLFGVGLPRRSTMTLWPGGIMGGRGLSVAIALVLLQERTTCRLAIWVRAVPGVRVFTWTS